MAKEKMEQIEQSENHKKALELAFNSVFKQFGPEAIHQYGAGKPIPGVRFFPSGSLDLDRALGKGYAVGRIIEIYGPESSGKTTLALNAVAEVQKVDPRSVLFIDAEHSLDPTYAEKLGVDMSRMPITQPDNGEQALNILETVLRSGGISLAIIDSVAALTPQKEIEGEMGDSVMGLQARLMSQALRKITAVCNQVNTTVIFLNQIRMKIGVMYGNPETTTGGNALKFYASQRLDVRRREKLEVGEGSDSEVEGFATEVKIVKNKVSPPFRTASFNIKFGIGIDRDTDLLNAAVNKGLIEKSGAWYSYKSAKIGQGANNTINFLKDNPDITEEIRAALQSSDNV